MSERTEIENVFTKTILEVCDDGSALVEQGDQTVSFRETSVPKIIRALGGRTAEDVAAWKSEVDRAIEACRVAQQIARDALSQSEGFAKENADLKAKLAHKDGELAELKHQYDDCDKLCAQLKQPRDEWNVTAKCVKEIRGREIMLVIDRLKLGFNGAGENTFAVLFCDGGLGSWRPNEILLPRGCLARQGWDSTPRNDQSHQKQLARDEQTNTSRCDTPRL